MLPPAGTSPTLAEPRASPALRWVPIRSLAERHRPRIAAHLLALDPRDRYLRFGQNRSDEQIGQYVAGLDFERDEVFGVFNRHLELIALAHLAYPPQPQLPSRPPMAEFGVSVQARVRGRGYGARLFEHAVMHARNRGTDTLYIHALSENIAMLKIARNAGAIVEREGSESEAWLKLPPDTLGSQVEELVETHAAELNYRFKEQAMRLEHLIEAVGELRTQLGKTGGAGSQ